jgi:hypothetical protein
MRRIGELNSIMPGIKVKAIAAFSDNYIWLLTAGGTDCAVVDSARKREPGAEPGASTRP